MRSIAAAAVLLSLAAPPAASAAPSLRFAPYGLVASNVIFVPGATVAERSSNYRRLYRAGVRAVRVDINWAAVEPVGQPLHDYDFRERDREITAIRRAGLKVIGLLAYGHPDYSRTGGAVQTTPLAGGLPPFYVGNAQFFPPDDPADFAAYAAATARHFGDEVIAWEIWNEQNGGWRFWAPHEDPAAYARLLCATNAAVKRVDPSTPVVYGGVFYPAVAGLPGMSGPDFLEGSFRADPNLGRCFDAVAYHPYPYPFTAPELEVPIRGSVLAAYDGMRAVLRRHGEGDAPLWITEIGWPTHDRSYGVSERKQAQYVARMQAASFAQGLPVLTWYTYGDYADPSGGANQEAWFGFFRPDGSAKPSYDALRTFARTFRDTSFRRDRSRRLGLPPGRLNFGGRGFALEYRGRRSTVTALWLAPESGGEGQGATPDGGTVSPRTLRMRFPVSTRRVTLVGYLGSRREVAARNGSVALELDAGPVYVVEPRGRGPSLRLRLRYRRLRLASRRRCARSKVRATVGGRDRRRIRRVAFYVGRRRVAVDRRAPFSRLVDRRMRHRGKPHRHRVGARVLLRDGGRVRLRRRFLSCGSRR